MTEHHRNQFLGKLWDACPHCYKHAYRHKIRPNGLRYYYCSCGTVWHWRKGSLRSPVCDTVGRGGWIPHTNKQAVKAQSVLTMMDKLLRLIAKIPGLDMVFKPSLLQVATVCKPMEQIIAEGFKDWRLEQGTFDTPAGKLPTWWPRFGNWLWKRTKHPCGHF